MFKKKENLKAVGERKKQRKVTKVGHLNCKSPHVSGEFIGEEKGQHGRDSK